MIRLLNARIYLAPLLLLCLIPLAAEAGFTNPFAVVAEKPEKEKGEAAKPNNIADVIHPNIHQNNGTNAPACPQNTDRCNNRHGIANTPGQSGDKPNDDDVKGFSNQLEGVHGGIGAVNKKANK